jgi:hypothetical protein
MMCADILHDARTFFGLQNILHEAKPFLVWANFSLEA